ncbi:hypothetical protein PHYSODRAFT_505334, partial [Phytophthora sojae]
ARPPPALLDRNGQIHYHRRLHGKRQLLVKWRGYPESDNSWEPVEQLQADCPKAVAIWDEKQRQLRK